MASHPLFHHRTIMLPQHLYRLLTPVLNIPMLYSQSHSHKLHLSLQRHSIQAVLIVNPNIKPIIISHLLRGLHQTLLTDLLTVLNIHPLRRMFVPRILHHDHHKARLHPDSSRHTQNLHQDPSQPTMSLIPFTKRDRAIINRQLIAPVDLHPEVNPIFDLVPLLTESHRHQLVPHIATGPVLHHVEQIR